MKPKTKTLLSFLHILSWIAFVGLAIKAGSFLISYIVSIKNPVASKDLYNDTGLCCFITDAPVEQAKYYTAFPRRCGNTTATNKLFYPGDLGDCDGTQYSHCLLYTSPSPRDS